MPPSLVLGRSTSPTVSPSPDDHHTQKSAQSESDCQPNFILKNRTPAQFPIFTAAPDSTAPTGSSHISFESPLTGGHSPTSPVENHFISASESSSKDPPVAPNPPLPFRTPIPAANGHFQKNQNQIPDRSSPSTKTPHSISGSAFDISLNFGSTNCSFETLAPFFSPTISCSIRPPISNSSYQQGRPLSGYQITSAILGLPPPIVNAQSCPFPPISGSNSVRFTSPPPVSAGKNPGSAVTASSPSAGAPPTSHQRVNSAESPSRVNPDSEPLTKQPPFRCRFGMPWLPRLLEPLRKALMRFEMRLTENVLEPTILNGKPGILFPVEVISSLDCCC